MLSKVIFASFKSNLEYCRSDGMDRLIFVFIVVFVNRDDS